MKIIKNPTNVDVRTVYGPNGNGQAYEIKAGESATFSKDLYPVVDHFISIYDFLEVTEVAEQAKEVNPLACVFCGFVSKSRLGRASHERHCKHKPQAGTPEIEPTPLSRVAGEVQNFGNADGLGVGTVKQELIGNRVQKVTEDRDGVPWYGPGLQADFVTSLNRKNSPGQF